jgi:hypothetical protein
MKGLNVLNLLAARRPAGPPPAGAGTTGPTGNRINTARRAGAYATDTAGTGAGAGRRA